jgi:hypothetical protein
MSVNFLSQQENLWRNGFADAASHTGIRVNFHIHDFFPHEGSI